MTEELRIGAPPISIAVRRRANARRLTLRISPKGPVLTIPKRASLKDARDFAIRKESWVRDRLLAQPARRNLAEGGEILIEGQPRRIIQGTGRRCNLTGDSLAVPGTPDTHPARIKAFLKERARATLLAACEKYAGELGRPFSKITLRDTRSRWGSCTSTGGLMFSWRLIMAPPDVLDYVAAHEVAHLVEMNHSDRFWRIVSDLDPDWQQSRDWLKRHGGMLHAYDFEA